MAGIFEITSDPSDDLININVLQPHSLIAERQIMVQSTKSCTVPQRVVRYLIASSHFL